MNDSFIPALEWWLDKLKPKRIIEWGPGTSTCIMLERCPNAKITSVEHSEKWFRRARDRFNGFPNLSLLLRGIGKTSKYAVEGWNGGPYDLAFVDGRRRVECALVAMQNVRPPGVVIMHDTDREWYLRPLRPMIELLDESNQTAVFRWTEW